ncbi:MAG: ribulose-phosphate 3-epimerase, partial [Clostridiales bacterium]|nr:ribulose-phosphate 3-epimerase [Clostridiales bacterium]
MNKVQIAPSLLSADFADMAGGVLAAERAGADLLHCDVMDGEFVPNITFGPKMVADVRKRTKLPLDAHLMIVKPERYIGRFIDAGADYVTIHVETAENIPDLLKVIQNKGVKAGVVLNPGTPLSAGFEFFPLCDLVLLMSVQPGFGGQKFMPRALEKLRALKQYRAAHKLRFEIEIDGGVTEDNAKEIREAGADIL